MAFIRNTRNSYDYSKLAKLKIYVERFPTKMDILSRFHNLEGTGTVIAISTRFYCHDAFENFASDDMKPFF